MTTTATAQTWETISLTEDPTGTLDVPDRRYHRSAGGTLWHLRHSGLLPGDATVNMYGHIKNPRPGTFGMWHSHPGCYTTSRRKTPEILTVDHVLANVVAPGARYTLCSCVSTHPHVALTEAGVDALRWLLDTDQIPDTPRHAAVIARALANQTNLTEVPDLLADRVRTRAALRRTQLLTAHGTRDYQFGVIYELSHDLAHTSPAELAHTIRDRASFLTPVADELAATFSDVADKCRDARFIDDLTQLHETDDTTQDTYPLTRRGGLHAHTWSAYTDTSVWLRCTPPGRHGTGPDREYRFLLDANDDMTLVRVPAAFLALPEQRHLYHATTRTLTWTALGIDHGYTADQVTAATKLIAANGTHHAAFADTVAALAAAAGD